MLTKPFNEDRLWKGKIQLADYKTPSLKEPMNLLPLTYHNGQYLIPGKEYNKMLQYYCHVDLAETYTHYSQKYWEGVEKRKLEYRQMLKLRTWS